MALAAVPAKSGVAFDVANRVFFRLYQASNLMHKQGTRYVSQFGTTTQQWAVLGALARPLVRGEGMTVKDLMEFLGVSRQNLTIILDRLEARDWIKRWLGSDGSTRSPWSMFLAPVRKSHGPLLDLRPDYRG